MKNTDDATTYAAMGERLTRIVEQLSGVQIAGKPLVPPGDLAFLSHLVAELGSLDHIVQSLTYQSIATAGAAVQDRQRADWLQAANVQLEQRARDAEARLRGLDDYIAGALV